MDRNSSEFTKELYQLAIRFNSVRHSFVDDKEERVRVFTLVNDIDVASHALKDEVHSSFLKQALIC